MGYFSEPRFRLACAPKITEWVAATIDIVGTDGPHSFRLSDKWPAGFEKYSHTILVGVTS
jgi:hypothetical protein